MDVNKEKRKKRQDGGVGKGLHDTLFFNNCDLCVIISHKKKENIDKETRVAITSADMGDTHRRRRRRRMWRTS